MYLTDRTRAELSAKPFAEQVKVFSTRYIYLLEEEGYAEVKDAAGNFEKACGFNETQLELNDPKTSKVCWLIMLGSN